MSILRRSLLAAATVAALSVPAWAQAQSVVEVGGVKYDPTIQVANAKLQLNGAGVRYKAIFKVYTAGLYLQGRAATPEQVIAATGPRRMHIVMLRDIDANELGKLFTRGVQDNVTPGEFSKSINGVIKMGEMFATRKNLKAGEWFTIDWIPGTGTVISVDGKQQMDAIKEPEFFSSLMHIWLGRNPADASLKEALLGQGRAAGRPET